MAYQILICATIENDSEQLNNKLNFFSGGRAKIN